MDCHCGFYQDRYGQIVCRSCLSDFYGCECKVLHRVDCEHYEAQVHPEDKRQPRFANVQVLMDDGEKFSYNFPISRSDTHLSVAVGISDKLKVNDMFDLIIDGESRKVTIFGPGKVRVSS